MGGYAFVAENALRQMKMGAESRPPIVLQTRSRELESREGRNICRLSMERLIRKHVAVARTSAPIHDRKWVRKRKREQSPMGIMPRMFIMMSPRRLGVFRELILKGLSHPSFKGMGYFGIMNPSEFELSWVIAF